MAFHRKFSWIFSVSLISSSAIFLRSCFAGDEVLGQHNSNTGPRIAIIGGGIGGTSCAYFLRKSFGSSAALTLYEPNQLGGRVATVDLAGRTYEAGGSIIHPRNRYMVQFAEKFGLKKRDKAAILMGAYNGEEFVFEESSWSIVTVMKMLKRYGWSVFKLQFEVRKMLKQFDRIYDLQSGNQSFNTVSEMVQAMGGESMLSTVSTPTIQLLEEAKFSQRFIEEIVPLATRVNYGQEPDMEGFAGYVSLAGAQPGLWAVDGGNKLVAEKLAERANLTELKGEKVSKVTQVKSTGLFQVQTEGGVSDYDIVVIATPLEQNMSSIEFDVEQPLPKLVGKYRQTYATFLDGEVNPKAFGKKQGEFFPDAVITTREIPLEIRSVAKNFPVDFSSSKSADKNSYVYKIFSTNHLSDTQINTIFTTVRDKKEFSWLAYPYYRNVKLGDIPPFVLGDGLFYPNAIEWAASAMEMAVIGGRNVAILAHQYWNNQSNEKMSAPPDEAKGEL